MLWRRSGCEGAETRKCSFGCWLALITIFRIVSSVRQRNYVNMQHLVPKKKTTQKTWCKTSLLLKSTNYLRLIRGLYEVTVGVCLIYFSVRTTCILSAGKT